MMAMKASIRDRIEILELLWLSYYIPTGTYVYYMKIRDRLTTSYP